MHLPTTVFSLRILLLLAIGLAAFRPADAFAASPVWIKLEGADFVIYSDASEKSVKECAVSYAAYRHVLSHLLIKPGKSLPPSVLIVFRSERDFQSYTTRPEGNETRKNTKLVNYNVPVDGTSYSTFALDGDLGRALELTFSFEAIWVMRQIGLYTPLWMAQGLGECVSSTTLTKDKIRFGAHDFDYSSESIEWDEVLTLTTASKSYQTNEGVSAFLYRAWSLMHWILFKDDRTRERLELLSQTLHTRSSAQAIELVMGVPVANLNKALSAHGRQTKETRELPFDQAAIRASFRISPLPRAEMLAVTANLLGATDQMLRYYQHLDEARSLAPELPAVTEAFARRMLRENRPDETARLYRESIAAGTRNFMAYQYSAHTRLNDVSSRGMDLAGEGGEPAVLAAQELRQAIALNPGSTEAYRLLGRAFYVQREITLENIEELTPGVTPGEGTAVRYYRGLLYARLGKHEEAAADFELVMAETSPTHSLHQSARLRYNEIALRGDQQRFDELVLSGNLPAARKLLNALRSDPNRASMIARWIEESKAWLAIMEAQAAEKWSEMQDAAALFLRGFRGSARMDDVYRLAEVAETHLNESAAAK